MLAHASRKRRATAPARTSSSGRAPTSVPEHVVFQCTNGVVLGLFDTASFEEETLKLEPGDLIVLFSDGVTEAMNAEGEEFTDDRLIACANAHRGQAPQQRVGERSVVRVDERDDLVAEIRVVVADRG